MQSRELQLFIKLACGQSLISRLFKSEISKKLLRDKYLKLIISLLQEPNLIVSHRQIHNNNKIKPHIINPKPRIPHGLEQINALYRLIILNKTLTLIDNFPHILILQHNQLFLGWDLLFL